MEKWRGFLAAGDVCLSAQEFASCVSRAYYAAYHAVAAVIEWEIGLSRRPWEHRTLVADFRRLFCSKSYLFDKRDADDLDTLLSLRVDADYERSVIRGRVAERALVSATRLAEKVREVIER